MNQEQVRAYEKQREHNRKVLHRLLDVILFLATQNLAFRGHRETRFSCMGKTQANEGNFLELIRLLSKYDGVLAKHISTAKRTKLYMSPQIQNDFIRALAQEVESFIVNEVKQAHFYGIILDTTIDISHKDQLSFCLRYVDELLGIHERFLQLKELKASDSASLFQELHKLLECHGLDIKWIRSQSYDGASNMSGKISGLQTRVKEVNSSALYVHCCAHNLNLVLAHSCDDCIEAVTFFGTIQKLYTFITSSHPRLVIFEDAQKELNMPITALQSLSETRWYCKYGAVKSVQFTYPALLIALENIIEREKTPENVGEAKGLLEAISKLEFLVMLELWITILADINSLSVYLQNKSMDVVTAAAKVKSAMEVMKSRRSEDHYKACLDAAVATATSEDVNTQFTAKRVRKRKQMSGEKSRDEPQTDPEQRFRTEVFFKVYDRLIQELDTRFRDFCSTVQYFGCLMPQNLGKKDMFHRLSMAYETDVDMELAQAEYDDFCILYNDMKPEKTIRDLEEMLAWYNEHDLQNVYPHLTLLYRIFGTIAVSSATSERTFSKLRIIKSYLRSTMGQERLSDLTLLSVEREITETLKFDKVIENFSRMTPSGKRNLPLP